SVMMKHVIGLMMPDEGDVVVFGQHLPKLSTRELLTLRERYGMVFQGAALLDGMTVADNIAFPLRERGVSHRAVKERVDEMLEQLKLTELARRMPSTISSGQRKRVGLARAIIPRPELIIYD